jgi:hypothetical protein
MERDEVNTHVTTSSYTRDVSSWSDAVNVAEKRLEQAYAQIARLRRSIAILKDFRDAGEPWPGTSPSEDRLNKTTQ